MISHVFIGTNDQERAIQFYSTIMDALGWRRRVSETTPHLAIWQPPETTRPFFVVGPPYDGHEAQPGNGGMVALMTPDRPSVDRAFAAAIEAGGTSEGDPGPRPHYHANYYGAYFRDLDGNKLCVCCHVAGSEA
jgi:catechol 2,3-dioxygenase-like lactoylglutathione lyase family enzyme